MKIIIFEDNQCQNLYPLGLFRPLNDLRIGSFTLSSLIAELGEPVATVTRAHFLNDPEEEIALPDHSGGPVLFINASVEPDMTYLGKLRDIISAGDPFLTTSGNRVAAALVPADRKLPATVSTASIRSMLLEMNLPLEDEMFNTIDWPHEAIDSHLRLFAKNLNAVIGRGGYTERAPGFFAAPGVTVASSAVIDTAKGPVVLDEGVTIMHFSYLEGPVHIGRESRIIEHSSIKDRTAAGICSKIGGEVEASNLSSYSNKQHHGFLGHSWVGRWVNLGAGTSTSDMKNTYGTVNIDYNGRRVSTGMQFLGSVIGDFAKTAVNTTLFTGKIAGVCSMIYGTVTTNVPSFSNYARSFGQVTEVRLEQVVKTQRRMFIRRGAEQNDRDIMLMNRVFELTRHERTMSEEQINF